jgi:tripartite-type tricarboxylate transporter receptor subunit TctC
MKTQTIRALAALLASLAAAGTAAQGYPAKPVRIVVPFGTGGGTDNLVRIFAPRLGEFLGQQVVVDNRPGASAMIGTELVVRAAPDGYTLVVTDTSLTVNPSLYRKMPYDTMKDLAPVILAASAPVILVSHPSLPVKSVPELVALARARKGELNYASGGIGASTHLGGELLKQEAKIELTHVPYKGTGPAIADVVAGQVTIMFSGISSAKQFVQAGRMRALAVTGERRNPAMPDVVTFKEIGLPGVDAGTYWGALAPAATPRELVQRINREIERALQVPEVRSRLVDLGYEVIGGPPERYADNIRVELAKWDRVVKAAGVKLD